MDYYRDKANELFGLSYYERDEDRNGKLYRLMESCFSRFGENTKSYLKWVLADGGGEWANYEPEACLTGRMFRQYENLDKKGGGKQVVSTAGLY